MNFFEHQDKAHKKTKRLIFYFVLALLFTIGGANAVIYGAIYIIAQDNPEVLPLMYEPIWLYISLIFIVVMSFGTLVTMLRVASGGVSIARMVNARSLAKGPQSFKEQQFINVVEEMAIASGTPVPQLFVMQDQSINAFVAGKKPEDTVMVVTTGALETLNREELQGVVGHEFSHIFNGDMKISLKLIGVLGGILVIGKIGQILLRSASRTRMTSSSSKKGNGVLILVLVGLGFMVIGYIGLFFGRMIKAAISRQRELLADACSVQYTRSPHGLVSAFRVMQSHKEGTHLETRNVEDVSHMCLGEAQWVMFNNLLGTHPPLEARIKAIDPNDIYPMMARKDEAQEAKEQSESIQVGFDALMPMAAGAMIYTSSEAVTASIANPGEAHFEYALALASHIPSVIREAARSVELVEGLFYAMFLHKAVKEGHEAQLKQVMGADLAQKAAKFQAVLSRIETPSLLPIFELTLQSFNQLDSKKKQKIYDDGYKLLESLHASPFHFALLTILGNRIKRKEDKKPQIVKLNMVLKEITYLITVLVQSSHQASQKQQACFAEVMRGITKDKVTMPKIDALNFSKLTKALRNLNLLTPLGKEQVILACIKCVTYDEKVLVEEAELLRAVCEALDCPLPPIISTK